ncbi:thymidine phosphorylase [Periophthalmus magnuspinnatus]|uniref:thymidine phosphorylase n=1 Tax=Periophthalmus magnuspinnatus TaxID=409849 RepID=UPI00145BDE51|nr:thymidine phosphorylase [Periophthalmus magnuspinnatus]XP_033845880.1 thymidine phosphorylase [Periophthalmus magnuspinnatus]
MQSIPDLIKNKRDGKELSTEEIQTFINAVTNKTIQECQMGAMLMAIWQKGMTDRETQDLTRGMMSSGEVMSWPLEWAGRVVDKHSTGGVGDKVSLVLAPALAACNCKVPMISGRGLAHTGGTLDKLESIPGYNINKKPSEIQKILASVGCCIVGQTETLVPVDRVLYALRDATSTVDSLPLINGSIISKKGAEALSSLVLDVKFGRAALYKDLGSAKELAESLVKTGNGLGIRTVAVLSKMNSTIGRYVGNSLEVIESLETLKGNGPDDLMELVTTCGGLLLLMTGEVSKLSEGKTKISNAVTSGAALSKFQAMLEAQGVAKEMAQHLCSNTDYYQVLRKSKYYTELKIQKNGVVVDIDGMCLAQILHKLGAGRTIVGEKINHSVGAELLVSLGDKVSKDLPWLRLHYETPAPTEEQIAQLQNSLVISEKNTKYQKQNLVQEIIPPGWF